MLTKLKNGDHVDFATATIIQVGEREVMSVTGTVIPDRVTIKWQGPQDRYSQSFNQCVIFNCDTLEEAQAEADRLAEIANNQRTGVVRVGNTYVKASDVIEARVERRSASCSCHVNLAGDRDELIAWFTPDPESEDFAAAFDEQEKLAHAYARDLMAQVAGAK